MTEAELIQEIEPFARSKLRWEQLPILTQKKIKSNQNYISLVKKYSFQNQLKWKDNLISSFLSNEMSYHKQLITYSREKLMMYPYHIKEDIIRLLRITPFQYYKEMIIDVVSSEKPFDSIPNFSAADCVRLVGIGRNQFMEIVNKSKNRSGWKMKKKSTYIKKLLPEEPIRPSSDIEPWWLSLPINSSKIIDELIKTNLQPAGNFDFDSIHFLYSKGFIYTKVPVESTDYITIPPLKNFVMNRTSDDYFEKLLYQIFVTHDERLSIQQIASLLNLELNSVINAVSVYCRLKIAIKKISTKDVFLIFNLFKIQEIKSEIINEKEEKNNLDLNKENLNNQIEEEKQKANEKEEEENKFSLKKRIGFIFDSALPAVLMSSLDQGLIEQGVTLFEVGKITEEQIEKFITELNKINFKIDNPKRTKDSETLYCLKKTIKKLRNYCKLNQNENENENENLNLNENEKNQINIEGLDMVRCESITSLNPETQFKVLNRNYGVLASMILPTSQPIYSISLSKPYHFGPPIPEVNSPWFKLFIYDLIKSGPPSYLFTKGSRIRHLPKSLRPFHKFLTFQFGKDSFTFNEGNILPYLNESLLNSPVLVQGLEYFEGEYQELNIGFPFITKKEEEENKRKEIKENEYNQENIQFHPLIKINEKLHLDNSIGFIKLMKICKPKKELNNNNNNNEESCEWILFDIKFGIPLIDYNLNNQIRKKIKENELFSEYNVKLHLNNMRKLSLKLLKFISNYCNTQSPFVFSQSNQQNLDFYNENSIFGKNIPFPNSNIFFENGKSSSFLIF
ncbi:protein fam91a1 [Anaeramoeba ignava]|uniref:Protein fam91a1 n=1 Tax=Anaeramoeba ignava TaxID=1746090 RepID=A0A9Q0RI79_ANAIG|nr:protein fam91a1 [Anaeramoeba ignava]